MEHDLALAELLEASFECFPERDYCVMGLPSTVPTFPLLEHFVRVAPRAMCTYPQEVYVVHRNAINSPMTVRVALRSDLQAVEKLVATIPRQELFLNDFKCAIYSVDSNVKAYVILNEDRHVGVAGETLQIGRYKYVLFAYILFLSKSLFFCSH